jgi:triacylglycerol lipase
MVMLGTATGCGSIDLPTGPSADGPAFAKGGNAGGNGGGKGKPGGGNPTPPPTHDPILFIHGYNSSGSTWNTMVGRFKQDGWTDAELHAWTYDYRQSNSVTATQLQLKIVEILAATGATRVDIVTHSMGSLSSRHYLKNALSAPVDAWVSLAGPNHGTDTANFCIDISCFEMRINSIFLNTLNTGDETPGATRYATWRSSCDFVVPAWSVPVDGGQNTDAGCVAHTDLQNNSTIYGQVRTFLSAPT